MKQKRTLLLLVAFAVLLAGAYLLYNTLSRDAETDQLVMLPQGNTDQQTQQNQQNQQAQQTTQNQQGQQEQQTQTEQTEQQTQTEQTQQQTQTEQQEEPPENRAPDFTVYDGTGNPVRLHDYVGKPIVLNFWASWCGHCRSEMPEFQQVCDEMDGQVQFLMVNAGGETAGQVASFLQQGGYTFPVLYDTAGQAAYAYGVDALPTTFFLNAKGEAVTYAVGAINKATLLRGIEMIR